MKFERLKKSHKKEIIIGGLLILGIISAITITTSRAKYRLTQSIPIVRGTVNYKPYDLKIMAMYKQKEGSTCTEDSCYDEITGEMPSSGYVVNENKTYCLTSNNEQVKGKIKTKNGEHYITGLKKNDKCYIWFDKKIEPTVTETLTKLNITNYSTTKPDFSKTATTDEGIFRVEDGMYGGYSYYWRGAATTNHIIFADKCWRIVRINGDGTIRLIYNGPKLTGNTCKGNGYNNSSIVASNKPYVYTQYDSYGMEINSASYVGWTYVLNQQRPDNNASGTASEAKIQTEGWFSTNVIENDLDKVADGKFCNDRSVTSGTWRAYGGSSFYYAAYTRFLNAQPTLSCPKEDVYTLKVGAITADELVYTGVGTNSSTNTNCFMFVGSCYWTMTPAAGAGVAMPKDVYTMSYSGRLISEHVDVTETTMQSEVLGLRPVINLKADTAFQSGGLGTSEKPYVVVN